MMSRAFRSGSIRHRHCLSQRGQAVAHAVDFEGSSSATLSGKSEFKSKEPMMRVTRFVCALVTAMGFGGIAHAVPISLFSDTDTFIERAQDIVIAKCISLPKGGA